MDVDDECKWSGLFIAARKIASTLKTDFMDCEYQAESVSVMHTKNRESVFHTCNEEDLTEFKQILFDNSSDPFFEISAEPSTRFLSLFLLNHTRENRCVGCYMGMVLGDYLGAPVEFLDALNSSNSIIFTTDDNIGFVYPSETLNPFRLMPGQWTDDASMGACIADSLLVRQTFSGRDIRSRFWQWCYAGYNNAFRKSGRASVGCGGNISQSLSALNGKKYSEIDEKYEADTEDSGNGGLMRLAPIPIFYSEHAVDDVLHYASLSSETTHPGCVASRAAEFMAFFIHMAINRPSVDISAAEFAENVVSAFLLSYCNESTPGSSALRKLLRSEEPSTSTEFSWNWKSPLLDIETCMKNRGDYYNGYSNYASYYGSFCLDGLAVALHSFRNGSSFGSSLQICINYRGDADSTAAITGQLCGAFYGFTSINLRLVNNALQWDDGENMFRAILLCPRFHLQAGEKTIDHDMEAINNGVGVSNILKEQGPQTEETQELSVEGIAGASSTNITKLANTHPKAQNSDSVKRKHI